MGLAIFVCAFFVVVGGAVGVGWARLYTSGRTLIHKQERAHPVMWALFVLVVTLLFIAQKWK